eukprot:1230354-Heterocapsa_arctica.AAC.1
MSRTGPTRATGRSSRSINQWASSRSTSHVKRWAAEGAAAQSRCFEPEDKEQRWEKSEEQRWAKRSAVGSTIFPNVF